MLSRKSTASCVSPYPPSPPSAHPTQLLSSTLDLCSFLRSAVARCFRVCTTQFLLGDQVEGEQRESVGLKTFCSEQLYFVSSFLVLVRLRCQNHLLQHCADGWHAAIDQCCTSTAKPCPCFFFLFSPSLPSFITCNDFIVSFVQIHIASRVLLKPIILCRFCVLRQSILKNARCCEHGIKL